MIQVAARGDEGAARFRHLLAVDGEESVRMYRGRTAHCRGLQHRRPEQRVKIQNVLAYEVMHFGARVDIEEIVELKAGTGAQLREARQISDRRLEPDVEILARRVRNLEAEVRRVARDVPVPQAL